MVLAVVLAGLLTAILAVLSVAVVLNLEGVDIELYKIDRILLMSELKN